MKRSVGRPKLPPEEASSHMLNVRVTPSQYARIEAAAIAAGMKPSSWARKAILDVLEMVERISSTRTSA